MQLKIELSISTAVDPSPNVLAVAAMFGLGIDQQRQMNVVQPTTIELRPGWVVFITGPSGSGKSCVLRLIAEALADDDKARVVSFNDLPDLPDRPLVDCFGDMPLAKLLPLLSLAGINDAFVMLRRPSELSDGQRYRLRLAQTMATVATQQNDRLNVLLADEFGATLDRLTAAVIARQLRKWTHRQSAPPVCFVAATTHDDLLEPLEPDVLIEKELGAGLSMVTRRSQP